MTRQRLILLVALYVVAAFNGTFFGQVLRAYPLSLDNAGFLLSLIVVMVSLHVVLFTLVGFRWTVKPVLIAAIVASAVTDYFMRHFTTVVDHTMITNVLETDTAEALDLVSPGLLVSVLLLGVLPAILVGRARVNDETWRRELLRWTFSLVAASGIIALAMLAFSANYASMLREHKPLRHHANPAFLAYSMGKYAARRHASAHVEMARPLGLDARIAETHTGHKLMIMVVGETVRADHLSLNGYGPMTNPWLGSKDVISFRRFTSCGTSTAVSVPCMFSSRDRRQFHREPREPSENVLDVFRHAGVNVLWRDNNSSSKGVATRLRYEDFRNPEVNPVCDSECRDIGMLSGLQEYIDGGPERDILIVLHQMGNHGPGYYKRYPETFEHFIPTCRTTELSQCSQGEINNAYDNAVRYTDYFLWNVIELLDRNTGRFKTAMFYVSDHGESLGENRLYLHGAPYAFAPEEQKRVAAIMWFSDTFEIDRDVVRERAFQSLSHDNVFHSLLGLMKIETAVYDPSLDIFSDRFLVNR